MHVEQHGSCHQKRPGKASARPSNQWPRGHACPRVPHRCSAMP